MIKMLWCIVYVHYLFPCDSSKILTTYGVKLSHAQSKDGTLP